MVPSLILQPLVENAVRHGLAPRPEGGRLTVSATRDGEFLRLQVADDGVGMPKLTKVKTKTTLSRTDYTIGDLETRLPNPPFFRAHRSAIVNLRMIREITPMFKGSYMLSMRDQDGSEFQVSERQSRLVRELLQP